MDTPTDNTPGESPKLAFVRAYIASRKPAEAPIVRRCLDAVIDRGSLDDEEVRYDAQGEIGITPTQFNAVFRSLECALGVAIDNPCYSRTTKGGFGEILIPLRIDETGERFAWRLLMGQGSACQIQHREATVENEVAISLPDLPLRSDRRCA